MKTVQTDADRRELAPHGTLLCPMEVHHDDPSLFQGGVIPCHWHEEIELSVVQQGRVEYTLGGGRRVLPQGKASSSTSTCRMPMFLFQRGMWSC